MNSITTGNNESGFSVYLRLLKLIKPDTHYLIIGFIGFAIYAACDSAFAWWMKELVDNIEAQNLDKRWFLASFIILIFLTLIR